MFTTTKLGDQCAEFHTDAGEVDDPHDDSGAGGEREATGMVFRAARDQGFGDPETAGRVDSFRKERAIRTKKAQKDRTHRGVTVNDETKKGKKRHNKEAPVFHHRHESGKVLRFWGLHPQSFRFEIHDDIGGEEIEEGGDDGGEGDFDIGGH